MLSVTVYLLAILAIVNATLDEEEFSCGRYVDVNRRFRDCLEEGGVSDFARIIEIRDVIVDGHSEGDSIIEGEEILTELTARCSNLETGERIEHCVESIVTDCPTLQEIILTTVENKISFFCENNQPSSMVREVLQHGYMFNVSCESRDNPVVAILRVCFMNASSEIRYMDFWNWSVSKWLSTWKKIDKTAFECGLEQASDQLTNVLECGSTGQDILIKYALGISGSRYLSPTLTASTMEKIKGFLTSSPDLTSARLTDIKTLYFQQVFCQLANHFRYHNVEESVEQRNLEKS